MAPARSGAWAFEKEALATEWPTTWATILAVTDQAKTRSRSGARLQEFKDTSSSVEQLAPSAWSTRSPVVPVETQPSSRLYEAEGHDSAINR